MLAFELPGSVRSALNPRSSDEDVSSLAREYILSTAPELGPGLQWIQIDLKEKAEIFAVVMWHYHAEPRVYRDVVVQVADDPDFITNVRTVFNNDHDNSAGLGLGKDLEYFESDEGTLVDGKGEKARYVRLYSKGNTSDAQNHYIEVEVYGKPAK